MLEGLVKCLDEVLGGGAYVLRGGMMYSGAEP